MQGSRFKADQRALPASGGEEGYLLLGAIVAIALVMIALSVAAVKVSFSLRREREEESVQRANQYVRAIREYYLKFGRYPGSVEQLENTNNIRFLRQRYVDPLTGKPDYRLIIVGQNKTQPVGFFGEALSGLPGTGPGAGTGTGASTTANAAGAGSPNSSTNGLNGAGAPGVSLGGSAVTTGLGPSGNSAAGGSLTGGGGTAGTQGLAAQTNGNQSAGSQNPTTGAGLSNSSGPGSSSGPIMGVGSSASGPSIISVNGQTTYQTWEFLYDPRVERLRQAGQLNQGVSSAGGNGNPAGLGGATQSGGVASPGATGSGNSPGSNLPGGAQSGAPPSTTQPPAQP